MLNEDIAEELERPYEEAREEGRLAERTSISAWLRSLFPPDDEHRMHLFLNHIAKAIEEKDHLE
jgi:hypothetical protein